MTDARSAVRVGYRDPLPEPTVRCVACGWLGQPHWLHRFLESQQARQASLLPRRRPKTR